MDGPAYLWIKYYLAGRELKGTLKIENSNVISKSVSSAYVLVKEIAL